MPENEPVPVMLDLFPARVSDGEQLEVFDTCRVILSETRFYVPVDRPTGVPEIVVDAAYTDLGGTNVSGWSLTHEDGRRFTFRRSYGGGCNCGSRVKGYKPFEFVIVPMRVGEEV